MRDQTAWYLTVETMIDGERRSFSKQMLAATTRDNSVPRHVNDKGVAFVADVMDGSDLEVVAPHVDHPYRIATYELYRDGVLAVSTQSCYPVRPRTDY